MSINKYYVRALSDLKNILAEHGPSYFYRRYSKPDILIGPSDSIEFIESFMKEYLD
jgi:hypothetical protein